MVPFARDYRTLEKCEEPPSGLAVRSVGGSSASVAWGQALGRLPWLAAFFLRARRLRPVLPMVTSSVDLLE